MSWPLSVWSRGMIPASGAGGPEFESRNGPLETCAFGALTPDIEEFSFYVTVTWFTNECIYRGYWSLVFAVTGERFCWPYRSRTWSVSDLISLLMNDPLWHWLRLPLIIYIRPLAKNCMILVLPCHAMPCHATLLEKINLHVCWCLLTTLPLSSNIL